MDWEFGISRCRYTTSPTAEHKELYSISYDKLQWKNMKKKIYIYIYICITELLCCTEEISIIL